MLSETGAWAFGLMVQVFVPMGALSLGPVIALPSVLLLRLVDRSPRRLARRLAPALTLAAPLMALTVVWLRSPPSLNFLPFLDAFLRGGASS